MGKSPTRDWPNPTRATVHLPVGEDLAIVWALLAKFLGEIAVPEDVAHVFGALDDSRVHLRLGADRQQIQAHMEHADFEQWERHLRTDKDGRVYIWNEKIRIRADKQQSGIGTQRLRAQVENAFYGRIAYIACHAARVNGQNPDPQRSFIGYSRWPKCGFDQTLDELEYGTDNADEVRKGTPTAFPAVAKMIPEKFGDDIESIQDLLEEEEGSEWWQINGVELYHAVFDLTAGSRSLTVFNEYLLDPKKGGKPLCLKNPI